MLPLSLSLNRTPFPSSAVDPEAWDGFSSFFISYPLRARLDGFFKLEPPWISDGRHFLTLSSAVGRADALAL